MCIRDSREAVHRPIFLAEFDQTVQVDPVLVVEASTHLGDANNFVSSLMHEMGSVGADVAESLHNHAAALTRQAELLDGLVAYHHHAAAGSLAASSGATDVDGLSGNARGHGLPHVHGVCVHHPGHDLFVGVDLSLIHIFQISRGMLQMRINVMELGRFTAAQKLSRR